VAGRRILSSALLTLVLLLGSACQPRSQVAPATGSGRQPVDFSFAGIDGQVIADESTSGRITVLLFATTFDLDSQAQAKFLEDLYRTHTPRLNAVLVFLEAAQYVELARSFRDVLELSYPVALADQEAVRDSPRFPDVRAVPTWLVLDRSSKLRAEHEGALDDEGLAHLVSLAE